MFPKISCPCGFEAMNLPNIDELYREHKCPKPHNPSGDWSIAATFISFFAMIVLIVWAVTS